MYGPKWCFYLILLLHIVLLSVDKYPNTSVFGSKLDKISEMNRANFDILTIFIYSLIRRTAVASLQCPLQEKADKPTFHKHILSATVSLHSELLQLSCAHIVVEEYTSRRAGAVVTPPEELPK